VQRDRAMQFRPIVAPLVASAVVVALAACSGSSDADANATPWVDDADSSVFGVAINANSPAQTPSREDLRRLGARWVRSILYDGQADALDAALRSYRCLGVKNLVLINQESFAPTSTPPPNDDNDGWETYASVFADEAEAFVKAHASIVDAVEIWNEPDLPADAPIAAEHFALLVYKVYPRLKAILGERAVIQGAVAGPRWPDYIRDTATWLSSRGVFPDGVGFHPYGQRSGGYPSTYPLWNPGEDGAELSNVINAAHDIANSANPDGTPSRPIWVTEFGLPKNEAPDGDVAPYVRNAYGTPDTDPGGANVMWSLQQNGILAHAFWFAWDDRVGAPDEIASGKWFGLVEEDGSPRALRASGQEYANAAGELPQCATDSASGVDGSAAIADLTNDDQGKLCDWIAGTLGGYGASYTCDGSDVSITKNDRSECVAAIPTSCSATVAQVENCVNAVKDDPCQVLARPECAAVRHCAWH
jgi:hypothetical protein